VPDQFHGLVQNLSQRIKSIVIAIGTGKNNNSKFHCGLAPEVIWGISILPQRLTIDSPPDDFAPREIVKERALMQESREIPAVDFAGWRARFFATSSSVDRQRP
jgi:hypothetical protein